MRCNTFNTYWLCPRETVCFVDPRLPMFPEATTLEHNIVNSVQRSRLHVMAHVIFFIIHRWITRCLPLALMRGRQSNFVTLTWYTLDQWNTWKRELWLLVYNNIFYLCMPSDIFWFPAIWLAAAAGGFLRYLDRGLKVSFFGEWPGVKS